ncbi:MAG: alanine racemase [Desulfobacteraceae bacterium]|nr:MAG: alanine racemase [Desulfobacteraceae bacterium]
MNTKTCAEINIENLINNIRAIQRKVAPSQVIPVVKADAYGHGVVAVTKRLVKEGFKLFAVAQFQEAMELRESGIAQPILIFGRLFPNEIPIAIKAGFRITLFGKEDIRWIEKAGQEKQANVHVNLETGMGRIGVLLDRELDFFDSLLQSQHCIWEGLYSHFSTSDEKDKTYANLQLSRFQKILSYINEKDKKPSIIHMANSGAILDLPESYFDGVRPGILLYGHYPSTETSRSIKLRQVMTLKTFVAHIRKIPAGFPVSYGRRWTAKEPTTIAVLPLGYADGIRRNLTNKGEVLIQGKRYPMVGTVTMDHIMIDVGNDPIEPGDEVIVWGEGPEGTIQALEVAEKIGTIPYELTCGVSKRVKRVYLEVS